MATVSRNWTACSSLSTPQRSRATGWGWVWRSRPASWQTSAEGSWRAMPAMAAGRYSRHSFRSSTGAPRQRQLNDGEHMARAMKVAIIDDEQDMRQSISQWLALSGFDTETYSSAEDALKGIRPDYPGVVISDIKMPGMDGMVLLKRLLSMDSGLPVIMITGHGDVPMAVEAMRVGAYDFLEKPFNPDRMTELAKRAGQARR